MDSSAASTAAASGSSTGASDAVTQPEAELPAEIEYGRFSEDELTRTIMAELAMQRGQNQEALDEIGRAHV